jgi:hypothetical protein
VAKERKTRKEPLSTLINVNEALNLLEARSMGNGSIQLFWSLAFSNVTVQATESLRSPRTWSPQPGTPTIQQGRYTMTILATSNPALPNSRRRNVPCS